MFRGQVCEYLPTGQVSQLRANGGCGDPGANAPDEQGMFCATSTVGAAIVAR